MKITMKRELSALVTAVLLVTASACGGGSDDDNPDPDDASAEATTAATPIPTDTLPTVDGNRVTSSAKGYSVTYPDGWEPRYNLVNSPTQKLDAYFGPVRADGGFRASISITCEQIGPNEDSRAYYERKRAVTEASADGEIIGPEQVAIGAVPAFKLEYGLEAGGDEVRKIDVFAANGSCGYTVSLASSPEELAQHLTAWQAFLASLTFV